MLRKAHLPQNRRKTAGLYTIAVAKKDAKGQIAWNPLKGMRITNDGQTATADYRTVYDADNLYLS